MEHIKEVIRQNLAENMLFTEQFELDDEASFLEEGVVDSTGVMDLVLFAEETFKIEIKDDDITPDNFDSVNKLAAYIHRKSGGP
jgi:acyl carrier protein